MYIHYLFAGKSLRYKGICMKGTYYPKFSLPRDNLAQLWVDDQIQNMIMVKKGFNEGEIVCSNARCFFVTQNQK